MPSYVFNDTLQSYALGPGVPTGFSFSGFFSQFGQVPPPGLFGNEKIYFQSFGNLVYPPNSMVGGTTTTQTSVFFSVAGNGNGIGTINLACVDPISFFTDVPLVLVFESDGSATINISGATPINSLIPVQFQNIWMFIQLVVQVGFVTISGTDFLTFSFQLGINGNLIINQSTPVISNVQVNPDVGVGINQWQFVQSTGYFGELVATSDIQTVPFYPNPITPMYARTTQLVTELIKVSTSEGRAKQIITELMQTRTDSHGRVKQIIVELIKKRAPSTASSIWMDAEAILGITNGTWTDS